ncbi:MFS transporter [Rhodocyclus tenuis]|uniref:BCD family chlorophyll transporter-like MFS transporter n=1 Tax=Rhodocyclus tenuis TaxID=1066 RepID=A0A840G9X6_RHOTE|nr:MFS transporter [Rhodocyclus tenuis]MBB4249133.1 BCD family chlorophyll transporter-like MFS transporter [Rhodocyclus tenuis]MBK1681349.1 MFS transporter [Rhodocyclus tenuis]
MSKINLIVRSWVAMGASYMPFADAASEGLPLSRLLRLSLFQVSVGMATVLLTGTLNRVMIVELGVPTWLVALMVSLPLVFAPFRALIGHKSDHHRSALGWKRVPYIWMGTLLQFGGLAIMPFALLLLSGDTTVPVSPLYGQAGAALAFLLVGAGLHTTQTAGLALATDLADDETRPRVVALFYVTLLLGMLVSALVFGVLLADFSQIRLIQVIQGSAVLTLALNVVALWKQEARTRNNATGEPAPDFRASWREFIAQPNAARFLTVVGLGSAAFSMQDILLEPYGGQILHLAVGATTTLTAAAAAGALAAFTLAGVRLSRGADPIRLAAIGSAVGVVAFMAVIFAAVTESAVLFFGGAALIGFGGGLFSVGTLTSAMSLDQGGRSGLALGAWGAVQASCAGGAIALGGAIRDVVTGLAAQGALGPTLNTPATGFEAVYCIEVALLCVTLIAIGPLVRRRGGPPSQSTSRFGLADLPG